MKTIVTSFDFTRAFEEIRPDNFTRAGLEALFNWFEELSDDTGEEVELDVIAICCEFSEYESADEAAAEYFDYEGMEYGEDGGEIDTPEEVEEKALEYLNDKTMVIEFDGGVIIQDF